MDPARPNDADAAVPRKALTPRAPSPADERRELDHRLANSLQLAADFLIFERARVRDPSARAALIEAAERLSAVGQMHRFLAAQTQAAGVDLDPFLGELGRLIADSTGLDCRVDSDPVTVAAEVAQQLAIAVNELAMNAAKHAYPWGARGVLHVTCRHRGERLVIVVADEGEGLGRKFLSSRGGASGSQGLGMTILEAVVRQLRGTLEAANDHGARFTITLPLPAPAGRGPRSFAPT
ncbi:sensor histidine kinase [Phenylobacterium sp.]|uniref:sensor histidine kinase n=1 Tax=Phenylobacterium sp. TaxID=1871053 RepID=UPI00286B37D2|nr:sensor histidine kinase [Phenylobacterium sp.]